MRNFSVYFIEPTLTKGAYLYEKGKSFQNTASYQMKRSIDLSNLSTPLLTETQIPAGQATISYPISLPSYTQGIFFSRDNRIGDHQWPNNTNRLLPWTFHQLRDITEPNYPGIPSNGNPSAAGDALLLQGTDGTYLFMKAISGANSLSWFHINSNGLLTLKVSTLGEDALPTQAPLLLAQTGSSPYNALQKAYQSLISNKTISALQTRRNKDYFEAFKYLGWCTWEHYHFNIDETKIVNDLKLIEASGLPIRYLLIDDGSIRNDQQQLTSLKPLSQKFPNGWDKLMSYKNKDKIRWFGLWYALSGYWTGISPNNEFSETIQKTLYPQNGSMLPGKSTEKIKSFYHEYVQTLKNYGFDFLKIDNQSFTLPLYMGGTQAIRQAKTCHLALEQETHHQQMGLMNCMAQNVLNTDHTLYSATARVSIDYKKYNANMAKSHLFQSYTNTLLQGQTVWPDHDMFHSSDSICGSLMARSKALSGGPIYLSDSPKDFVKGNILPLIDEKGKLFRPLAPGIPTPESVIMNPLQDGKAYRVFAPTGDEAVSLICYNLNVSPQHQKVTATLRKADYEWRETLTGAPVTTAKRLLLFDWQHQTAKELTEDYTFELTGFSDCLFHLCPIHNGWAVIGIQEKYLSPATVQIISSTPKRLILQTKCAGTLKVWVDANGKQELRSIPVKAAEKIILSK
ncbi:MAG: Sip1-related alpha-galactosidase [Bacteroidaceae bacterium]